MCGGFAGKILSNPIVDTVLSVAAPTAGAEFLGPLLGGGAFGQPFRRWYWRSWGYGLATGAGGTGTLLGYHRRWYWRRR